MKRKTTQPIPNKIFKRKDTMSCYSAASDKDHSIYDYFSLISSKGLKKASDKPLSLMQDVHRRKFLNTKYFLVKNPSKHLTPTTECTFPEANHSNLFTEDTVNRLIPSFERVISEFKSAFASEQFYPFSFEEEGFSSFVNENLGSILIKYLLQLDDNLLFIPKGLIQSINDKAGVTQSDREMSKLLTGFDDSKHIALKYAPINIKEAKKVAKGLCETLMSYLNTFSTQSQESRKGPQKALVIYSPEDYLQYSKLIETICNDHGFETIRIDDLETQKLARMKTLGEATRSQRLSSLSEDLIYKMNVIESIVNYHKAKWNNLTQIIDENAQAISESTTVDTSENSSTQSCTDPTFIKFQQNVHEIFIAKRTMLFIVDSFTGGDEDKAYLANIISRIPTTKCPIVLLTNNLSLLTANQSTTKHFVFYHWTNRENTKQKEQSVLYLSSFVLFIHLYLSDVKEALTKEEKSKTFYDGFLINELNKTLRSDVFRIKLISEKICQRVIRLAMTVALKCHFRIEEILVELSRLLRSSKVLDGDKDEVLRYVERQVYYRMSNGIQGSACKKSNVIDEDEEYYIENGDNDSSEDKSFIDINSNDKNKDNHLEALCQEAEVLSIEDYYLGKTERMGCKRFKYKTSFKSFDKEEIDLEDYRLTELLQLSKNSNNDSLSNVFTDTTFHQLSLEDKRFYASSFISSIPFITFKSLPFHLFLIKHLSSISHNLNSKSLSSRLINKQFNYNPIPSSTNNKKKSKSAQRKERSVIGKLFRTANDELIHRYLQAHEYRHIVRQFKQSFFANVTKESLVSYCRHMRAINSLKPNCLMSSISISTEFDLSKSSFTCSKERRNSPI